MNAPAGHVTVAAVPKLLPVPHAVDSTDGGEPDLEPVREALTDGEVRPAREAERVALADGEPTPPERETEREAEREALTEGETAPPERDAERVALTDDEDAREAETLRDADVLAPNDDDGDAVGERDAERLRLAVGDSPAWHCTYRMYVREPPQPEPVAAASCVLGLIVHVFCHRHVALAKAPLVVAASLHVALIAKGPFGQEPVGLP